MATVTDPDIANKLVCNVAYMAAHAMAECGRNQEDMELLTHMLAKLSKRPQKRAAKLAGPAPAQKHPSASGSAPVWRKPMSSWPSTVGGPDHPLARRWA